MPSDPLPFVDAHEVDLAADAATVWRGLSAALDRSFARPGSARYARLVGVADPASSGPRPLAVGATLPGFHVVTAIEARELSLEGRHRFSVYRLTFRLTPSGNPTRTRLRAETHATFPGPAGRLYRILVVTSGAHAAGMRRILAAIRRAAA